MLWLRGSSGLRIRPPCPFIGPFTEYSKQGGDRKGRKRVGVNFAEMGSRGMRRKTSEGVWFEQLLTRRGKKRMRNDEVVIKRQGAACKYDRCSVQRDI